MTLESVLGIMFSLHPVRTQLFTTDSRFGKDGLINALLLIPHQSSASGCAHNRGNSFPVNNDICCWSQGCVALTVCSKAFCYP